MQDKLIADFKRNMKDKMGIDLAKVEITRKSESSYIAEFKDRRVPYLSLYTLGDSYEKIIGYPERMGLVSEDARIEIISIWMNSIDPNETRINELYDPYMYVGVERFEMKCYWDYAINMKDEVQRVIVEKLKKAPRSIYSSSTPGLNIVYETEDYNQLNVNVYKYELSREIRKLAKKYVDEKFGSDDIGEIECILKVNFWHPGMPNYNGYGLARQD